METLTGALGISGKHSGVASSAGQYPYNAAFISSCHEHCGQWGQNQTAADGLGPVDYLVVIDGTSQMAAFDAWLGAVEAGAAPPRRLWNQEASYPCDACCSGGQ